MDMDWTQAVTIIGTNLAVTFGFVIYMLARTDNKFEQLLNRMDSNQKELEQKMDSNQKENNAKFEVMNSRFNGLENRLTAMEVEIKNTNQRIDSTNQRITDFKTDMNQRLSTIEGYLVPKKVFHFEEPDHKDEPKEN